MPYIAANVIIEIPRMAVDGRRAIVVFLDRLLFIDTLIHG